MSIKNNIEVPVDLPATGYVRLKKLVPNIIPFSAATLWRKVAAHTFPALIKLSAGVTAWQMEDVCAWMQAQE